MSVLALCRSVVVALLVAGVAASPSLSQPTSPAPRGQGAESKNLAPGFGGMLISDRLLLMPIDVELFSLSAGGIPEPRADWTAQALKHMNQAIRLRQQQARMTVVELSEAQADDHAEQLGLHAAVAQSIALHQFGGPIWALPTKAGRLDWSFGDAMQPLADATGAQYALFFWVRDSYASAERVAMMVAMAALGIGISGGVQIGYASLVDLRSGQVVWFNQLTRPYGDLRQAEPARETIDALLISFPAVR
jgi:hypothetical protein